MPCKLLLPMPNLSMLPPTGQRLVRHAGDFITFQLLGVPEGWTARLRTNLGRAERQREEVVSAHFATRTLANASWRDIPLNRVSSDAWGITLPVTEVGYFKAKAYANDPRGFQHWPVGHDVGISVHPSWTRVSHPVYCAFPRMFGPNKHRRTTLDQDLEAQSHRLDSIGYTVIPRSGTLRDLKRELPHIIDRLGCRLIHLLPVSPTPTTFARFGRFGSPYALQNLTGIDPALIEFDKRTTGIQQFCELSYAVHDRDARLMLDLVINHTGWGSTLWEEHPEWFVRRPNGEFKSPGAWDAVWEDLVELDQSHADLWEYLAEAFVIWCRRGVDAFRCDAGYQVPTRVWKHITSRVRQEFPDTVFLLEGLGGPMEATEALLTEGGMQWAYSELFQNYSTDAVTGYLDHSLRFGREIGTLVNYSETHDNARLAAHPERIPEVALSSSTEPPDMAGRDRSRSPNWAWSRYRNRLSALTSVNGAFGFTNGVEWLATEQINVHSSRGLAWGSEPNLVVELARLNELLRQHPCFFAGATLRRLSDPGSPIYALERISEEGKDSVVVLINTDVTRSRSLRLAPQTWALYCSPGHDLANPGPPAIQHAVGPAGDGWVEVTLEPAAIHCLAASATPSGLHGEDYRRQKARADWALSCWWAARLERPSSETFSLPGDDWQVLAGEVDSNAADYLNRTLGHPGSYLKVVTWTLADQTRLFLVPPGHWLLLVDSHPFQARLSLSEGALPIHVEAIQVSEGWIAAIPPGRLQPAGFGELTLERYQTTPSRIIGFVTVLPEQPDFSKSRQGDSDKCVVLLTNGRGAMARLQVDLGAIQSKYDCLFGANLDPSLPVDRHVFAKRLRVWINADGFISQLNADHLAQFESGPPARWRYVAPSGDGRYVAVSLVIDLIQASNTVVIAFKRTTATPEEARGARPLPLSCRVSLTVRIDIEDRNFHSETKRNSGAEAHFASHCRPFPSTTRDRSAGHRGFEFTPSRERHLRVIADAGEYHPEPEWSLNIPHPIEANRGQEGYGDAYSPGWFELPLVDDATVHLVATAETAIPGPEVVHHFVEQREELRTVAAKRSGVGSDDPLGIAFVEAIHAFLVRRDDTLSVIAGYPWFLDWGRDSLIAARGLLAAGLDREVRDLLCTFARFELGGTLPNSIHGSDASNRDTSDAPLWFGVVCEEAAARLPETQWEEFYSTVVDLGGRTLDQVLRSIGCGYLSGTSNGIRVDPQSGLVWSPAHFTWMDTNYPAGTPREGYPVEIQALWIRLLRQLSRRKAPVWEGRGENWGDLASRAEKCLHLYFWIEEHGWYADVLQASPDVPARMAAPSDALRGNCLFIVSLEIDRHPAFLNRVRRMVTAATRHLLVPGALRSLAPLPVNPPLPIYGSGGRLLNDPAHPYWPRYEGDEDTRRKPAYHNGTAWLWTFPTFIEALVRAHPDDTHARAAARAYLGTLAAQLQQGCLGQLPEVVDGDFPHKPRGCDAQAWSVTEALRVWRWLNSTILDNPGNTSPETVH